MGSLPIFLLSAVDIAVEGGGKPVLQLSPSRLPTKSADVDDNSVRSLWVGGVGANVNGALKNSAPPAFGVIIVSTGNGRVKGEIISGWEEPYPWCGSVWCCWDWCDNPREVLSLALVVLAVGNTVPAVDDEPCCDPSGCLPPTT